MPTEKEIAIIQKATIYDIIKIIEAGEQDRKYTPAEIKNLLDAYIRGVTQ